MTNRIKAVVTAGALAAVASTSSAQSNSDLLNELKSLKSRISDIESKLGVRPVNAGGLPLPDEAKSDLDKPMKWSDVMVGNSTFKLYGFLRMDAVFDDSRPNNSQIPAFIRSENAGGTGNQSGANNESYSLYPRLTRIGLNFDGPNIDTLWGAESGGKLELDFANRPSSESRAALRIRHAYFDLKWDDFRMLFGQTRDLISQYYPIINADLVMWGAGNLGDRRPQIRAEYTPQVGPGRAVAQAAIGLSSAVDGQDLDGNGFRDGEASGLPTVQGRIGYRLKNWTGKEMELAGWGHFAREKADIAVAGINDFTSEAWGIDLNLPLYQDIVSVKGELWTGRNLSDIRGGILQGVNTVNGREISASGGWAELIAKPKSWISLHGGYSFDNPHHDDLITTLVGAPTGTAISRDLNSIWYLSTRFYFNPIEIGFNYLNWTTYYADNIGKGTDNRFEAQFIYKF